MTTATTIKQPQVCDEIAHDLVWGALDIGAIINADRRTTYYLLEQGLIPAKKIGKQWVGSRKALMAHFGQAA